MPEFLADLARYSFLQYALAAAVLAAVASGIIGSFITVRRIGYIAGAISHTVLGGMGLARYLNIVAGVSWLQPMHGAVAFAVLAALITGAVTLYSREREDTVLGAIWAIGMAVGILFIFATPGYNEDLMSYLFGNILMIDPRDLLLMAGLDLLIVVCTVLFYNQLLALSFDEEFARLRGVRTDRFYLLLLLLTSLTIVVLVQVVGLVLVIALLTLPAAAADHLTRRLWQMMIVATLAGFLSTAGGLAASYRPNLPAGATIIVFAGALYLLAVAGKTIWRRVRARRRLPI
jgi:zinc transport system permease protein